MVNQLLAGVHITSAAEGIAFGARLGLNTQLVYDIVSNSSGSSWFVSDCISSLYPFATMEVKMINLKRHPFLGCLGSIFKISSIEY